MSTLALVFMIKIAVTIGIVVPLFILPRSRLDALTGFGAPTTAFYRLYAMALTGLIVAYCGGLVRTMGGEFPTDIVVMGAVSNLGATAVLLGTGHAAQVRALTAIFGLVGLAFAVALIAPGLAMG